MPSFRDAVAGYKAAKSGVPVNPPEAVKVLEEQSTPEVESPKAAPATSAVILAASGAAQVAPLPSTPAVEESRRKRRTKAEMEAARASAPPQPGSSSASTAEQDEEAATTDEPSAFGPSTGDWRSHVAALEALGFRVSVEYHTAFGN